MPDVTASAAIFSDVTASFARSAVATLPSRILPEPTAFGPSLEFVTAAPAMSAALTSVFLMSCDRIDSSMMSELPIVSAA